MQRSRELMSVGCFLSRFGAVDAAGRSQPPSEIGAVNWNSTYLCFYRALTGGRTLRQFGHALKNTRDEFDGFFNSGRVGWRAQDAERGARPLTPDMQVVFDEFSAIGRAEHWARIEHFHCSEWLSVSAEEIERYIERAPPLTDDEITSRSEGGRTIVISNRVERDPLLRAQAVILHGANCAVCGFDFERAYGIWGRGFCEVHHVLPLGNGAKQRVTNPLYDLVVLCANCHRMIHRRHGVTLTVDELRAKLRAAQHFGMDALKRGQLSATTI